MGYSSKSSTSASGVSFSSKSSPSVGLGVDDNLLDLGQRVTPCGDLREVAHGGAGRVAPCVRAGRQLHSCQHDGEDRVRCLGGLLGVAVGRGGGVVPLGFGQSQHHCSAAQRSAAQRSGGGYTSKAGHAVGGVNYGRRAERATWQVANTAAPPLTAVPLRGDASCQGADGGVGRPHRVEVGPRGWLGAGGFRRFLLGRSVRGPAECGGAPREVVADRVGVDLNGRSIPFAAFPFTDSEASGDDDALALAD